jgi:hypothetical protein
MRVIHLCVLGAGIAEYGGCHSGRTCSCQLDSGKKVTAQCVISLPKRCINCCIEMHLAQTAVAVVNL